MTRSDEHEPPFVALAPGDRPARVRPAGGGRPARPLTRELADALGPLAPWVADPEVSDVFCNGHRRLFVDRGDGAVRVPGPIAPSERAMRALAVRIVAAGGRHLDEAAPCIDVRLGDGLRAHAVLPPVAPEGTLLSLRMPRPRAPGFRELRASGFLSRRAEGVLREAVAERANILVTGAGGSGKTTLLSALLELAPPHERIVAIEDVAELRPRHPHFVRLEARQANIEGRGEVPLVRLVREALRMRPDRLVLGECRGAEVRELLAALNTGHDGGAGTLHANSLDDVPARLEALGALAGMDAEAVARQTVSGIGLVVHLQRSRSRRGIAGIGRFGLDGRDRLRLLVDPGASA